MLIGGDLRKTLQYIHPTLHYHALKSGPGLSIHSAKFPTYKAINIAQFQGCAQVAGGCGGCGSCDGHLAQICLDGLDALLLPPTASCVAAQRRLAHYSKAAGSSIIFSVTNVVNTESCSVEPSLIATVPKLRSPYWRAE
eukprot:scaffold237055_cov39-Prasinocladus_malaysianus.AAC.4